MIVATPKPVTELKNIIARHGKVLFVGCGTCVTVCLAGGERLKMVNLSAAMAPTFVQRVEEIVAEVRALGPNPLREKVGAL